MIDENDLLTIDQTAYELGVARRTLEYWREKGIAPLGVTICGKCHFFKSSLPQFERPKAGRPRTRKAKK
jgi:hypothetical protein